MALRNDDPHAKREASNYENPIPSREFILSTLTTEGRPLSHAQLCTELGLVSENQIEALRRRLRAMERDGQLMNSRRGGYGLVDHLDLIAGRVLGHRDGYGFLIRDDSGEDIFLHNRQMRKLFDGDRALVRPGVADHRGRIEGKVIEVLERNTQQIVGRFYREGDVGFVVPENSRICADIAVSAKDDMGVGDGYYVLAEIVNQPGTRRLPTARIVDVLGAHMAPGMEIEVAIRNHEIPNDWPSAVLSEAGCFGAQVAEEDKGNRVDLRDLPFVTIDGEDARDFDDAVYCEAKKSGGWRLYVAIADVSHYVAPGSALDAEAHCRGTSVYFPEHVVPMLPEALSNGLCSLNPDVDRLAMVCEMTLSAKGKLSGYQFYEGVIKSHARLTYNQVGALLETPESRAGKAVSKQYAALVPHLYELFELYKKLREMRTQRGAIDFETTETRIAFGSDRKIDDIIPITRNVAHKLIEECMLCANVATARFVEKLKKPALFRVHQGPKAKKLENLRAFLGELGLNLGGGAKPEPAEYQVLMEQIQGRPDAHIIQTMMLRSLSQAVYTPENEGHFGLGYEAYTHFTSPIRRYPDLLTHRLIRAQIRSGSQAGFVGRAVRGLVGAKSSSDLVKRVKGAKSMSWSTSYPYDAAKMLALGEHCSMTERRADEATREVVAWLKCEYMQDCIGQEFEGVVSAVTAFGLFVELKGVFVEGLVHVTALKGDYYHFEAAKQRLIGEHSRTVYRLGDMHKVRVVRVDLEERKIDFELVDKGPKPKEAAPKKRKRKRNPRKGASA
ncbi:MAG: ribonuclease R [Motiliproteus sp.]